MGGEEIQWASQLHANVSGPRPSNVGFKGDCSTHIHYSESRSNHQHKEASYRKVWLAKQRVIGRIYEDWRSHTMSFLVGYSLCRCTYLVRFITLSLVVYA
ncbi:hypothetical protein Ahy_B08g091166 isoform B [Arachis hypogaea]|uniref:Uncharacterized protein n=1 Tax=Arachis hypogaea TaxID=3818 RepID=A0A444Y1J2_ARAHY|nr:hypothetical protein Ahy_B08g091166 isoform B [Arachis hypogaea]